jgi:hypothetical protein
MDFLTTYRCGKCLGATVIENRCVVESLDEDMREKFCRFLERHGYEQDAEFIRRTNLPQAQAFIEMFINSIGDRKFRLSP